MNRRQLLLASAASAAGVASGSFARVPRQIAAGDTGAVPMPQPTRTLPSMLPETDPARIRLERGWRFQEGDVVAAPPANHEQTYLSVKAGECAGRCGNGIR
ncbi:hypothetical protein ABIC16_000950 [Sphingomonas sp. PvP055]|uniref:hypothetical protein n=1 Tax=Sphingomonas sp. PvP055 TaxID=3156391 RepID=UPI00339241F9